MDKKLVLEEINRIGYMMNYNVEKPSVEQINLNITEERIFNQNIISEAPPAQAQQKQGQQTQQQKLTPEQMQAAKAKVQAQSKKRAEVIFQELKKAMDIDGDNVLNDYDGTNEGGVVAAIKKINSTEILDYLNQRVKQTKQFGSLKAWINDELSDFDSEYGQIWNKLESLGYAGANYNILLKAAGYTPLGQMVKMGDKAIDKLRSLSFEDIMEGFREIVGGTVGTIGQLIIGAIPGIGQASVGLINGVLLGWDAYQLGSGSQKFSLFNFIFDIISVGLSFLPGSGVVKVELKTAQPALAEAKTAETLFQKMATKFPKIFGFFSKIGESLAGLGGKFAGLIERGLIWLAEKIPFLGKFINAVKNVVGKIGSFLKSISNAIKGAAGSVITKTSEKLIGSELTSILKQEMSSLGKGLFAKLESKLGKEATAKIEKKTVEEIEKYAIDQGKGQTIESGKKYFCAKGKNYCDAFNMIVKVEEVIKTGKEGLKKGSKGLSGIKTAQNTKDLLGGIEGTTKGVQKLTKADKEGTKVITGKV